METPFVAFWAILPCRQTLQTRYRTTTVEGMTSASPRTLTQMLREWDDDTVTGLLLERPDLAFPSPEDFSQIASRATTRHSVAAAADLLNAFELWLACQVVDLPAPVSPSELEATGADPVELERGLERLRRLALLWGGRESLRPVRVLPTLLEEVPRGAAPPATPPELVVTERLTPKLVDKVAAGSAFEFVRRMDVLVEHCDHQPLRRRRDGGLTTRQVRGLGALLDVPAAVATACVELAESSGLLGLAARGLDEVLIPTEDFDDWQGRQLSDQWAHLVQAWTQDPGVGAPEWLTQLCFEGLMLGGEAAVIDHDSLLAWLAWRRPRRPVGADRKVRTALEQATWMGVLALGATSSFGPAVDAERLETLMPDRVDHVLVQADLTAIAPGPLTVDAARDLATLADVESRGGATVYRFSAESLHRARQLGWDADEILELLGQRSSTPLPQPLTYLVRDLDRVPPDPGRAADSPFVHLPPERAKPRPGTDDLTAAERLDEDMAAQIVTTLRSAIDPAADQEAPERRTGALEGLAPEGNEPDSVAVLREAVETREPVWFGFVDSAGTTGERLVLVHAVDDGVLDAEDARSHDPVRMPVHRITQAHIIRTSS
jgi:hypothetical protein